VAGVLARRFCWAVVGAFFAHVDSSEIAPQPKNQKAVSELFLWQLRGFS
jgi:hypothetical protein